MLACLYNRENIVNLLLQIPGINLNEENNTGATALQFAASGPGGFENVVKLLLSSPNINVNAADFAGWTALISACYYGYENIVKLILNKRTLRIGMQDKYQKTALIYAQEYKHTNIVKLIQDKISELTNKIFEAIKNNDLAKFKSIVWQIDIVNDHSGNTFLHTAFAHNATDIITYILGKLPDPREFLDIRNNTGQLALELTAPTSDLFKFCMDLAYGAQAQLISKSKRKCPDSSDSLSINQASKKDTTQNACASCSSVFAKATSDRSWHTSEKSDQPKICSNCAKPNCIERCGRCHAVYYCDLNCQRDHWKIHKAECLPDLESAKINKTE